MCSLGLIHNWPTLVQIMANVLVLNMREANIWTNTGLVYWRLYAACGLTELVTFYNNTKLYAKIKMIMTSNSPCRFSASAWGLCSVHSYLHQFLSWLTMKYTPAIMFLGFHNIVVVRVCGIDKTSSHDSRFHSQPNILHLKFHTSVHAACLNERPFIWIHPIEFIHVFTYYRLSRHTYLSNVVPEAGI